MSTPLLEISGLSTGYGSGGDVLHGITLEVGAGEIVALIGANGAGKTTTMMSICGNPRARRGRVLLEGRDITALPTHAIARLGLAHAPEGRHVFPRMSVAENLALGGQMVDAAGRQAVQAEMFALFPRLAERSGQMAGTLSGGEQQMLAIARALMSRPRLLLLDEPSLGLAPIITQQIFASLTRLNQTQGLAILLVEQNARLALRSTHRGYVLVNGRITLSGPSAALLDDPHVQAAYLEGGAHA